MKIPMVNTTDEPRRVSRGAVVYAADPGQVVDVYPMDVGRLSTRGFARVDRIGLDDLTMDELRDRLPDGVDVPAKIRKGELVELVRTHLEA